MNRLIIPGKEPGVIEKYYEEIAEAYITAFAGDPWNEVSKCPDPQERCISGFSSQQLGELCVRCELSPTEPAYTQEALIERFNNLQETRPTAWYLEFEQSRLALAAVAWAVKPWQIAEEKYKDNPRMYDWITEVLPYEPVVWLDDIFANKSVRATANLSNFNSMNRNFMDELDCRLLAYRSITPQMISKAQRIGATVFSRNFMVPDRRDFVVLQKWDKQ